MESHKGFDYCFGSRFSTIFCLECFSPQKNGEEVAEMICFEELLV